MASATLPRSGLRKRQKLERQERIFHAAIDKFREKGFAASTIEEIAAAAGVAKGTFFNYFPSKEAVLLYLGERQTRRVAEAIGPALAAPETSAAGKLRLLFGTLATGLEEEPELTRTVVQELVRTPDLVLADQARATLRATLIAILTHGQAQGDIRRTAAAAELATLVEGAYYQSVLAWCLDPEPASLAARLTGMVDLLLEGLSPR